MGWEMDKYMYMRNTIRSLRTCKLRVQYIEADEKVNMRRTIKRRMLEIRNGKCRRVKGWKNQY